MNARIWSFEGPDVTSVILFAGLAGVREDDHCGQARPAPVAGEGRRKPLFVAADLVRPAAVDQLAAAREAQIDVPVHAIPGQFKDPLEGGPGGAEACEEVNSFDTLIIDTAGRMQVDRSAHG